MNLVPKIRSIPYLWLLGLLVVVLGVGENRAWGIIAPTQLAPKRIEAVTPAGIGENLAADIQQDISHNLINWEWTWKHVGGLGLNVVALAPGLGVIKSADEAIGLAKAASKSATTTGLTTPIKYFGNKTAQEVSEAMTKKFGPPKNIREGAETFYNPKTQRSYNIHTDPDHGPPHIDIRRRGGYPEKKYPLKVGEQ